MFTNHQNPIAQVRRELRGKFPDGWLDEVLFVIEYGDSLEALSIEDLLKLKVAALVSTTLKQRLDQGVQQVTRAAPQPRLFGRPVNWF